MSELGSDKLTEQQAERLWDHGQHEDTIFNSRINFFLVIESLFLGVVINYAEQSQHPNRLLLLIGFKVLGIFLTFVWWYASARQRYVLEGLRKRFIENFPEYVETRAKRDNRKWRISVTWLLTHGLPAIFLALWIYLFFLL